ncbi:hypothetical protein AN964_11645 [Heyndrickxia shackletonii]|uniref:Uncharacterized protein n=1 Tax=Heyndrickxia shackletonii TaxID=157838 RepID=A0A0Q3WX97_9BACI|nr:hypothetical protein AN964_11645 [Heyndrickxia shackletonii]
MKLDFKKKKIQLKYKEQFQNKQTKKHSKEILITVCLMVILLLMYILFKDKLFQHSPLRIMRKIS